MCYFYRHPPPGSDCRPLKWTAIAQLVWNTDGRTHPTPCSVRKCVLAWRRERGQRGRKKGWRKTTRDEDKRILASFQKARLPLGSEVTARDVAGLLPTALRTKVSLRAIRRRLAAKGYVPGKKIEKADFLRRQRVARMEFCRAHRHRTKLCGRASFKAVGI